MKELTTKQRLKYWFDRKLGFWQELIDAMLLEEPLFKIPKRNKYHLKNVCRKVDKITFCQKLKDFYWWYFSKEAKCYRATWSITRGMNPGLLHFYYRNLHYKASKKLKLTTPYDKPIEVIDDFKPGTSYIHFGNPPKIRLSNFKNIAEELTPLSAIQDS